MGLEQEETSVVLAEPYFDFSSIQEAMNEIFFEEYNFKAMLRTNCKWLHRGLYRSVLFKTLSQVTVT